MIDKLRSALSELKLEEEQRNITVALSGGKDSMALLRGLIELQKEFELNIKAAHFNHLLRGDESFRDESFVKHECEKIGVPLIIERGDVNAYAKLHKIGTEEAARILRYEFFEHINTGTVATAHTASDNFETLLFHILRGSGLDGLCGIPSKRGIYIRPLLDITTDEILEYCSKNSIKYVTDSTNLSADYSRNFLRLNVIPLLKQLNPSVEKSAQRLFKNLKSDKSLIDAFISEKYDEIRRENGICVEDFSAYENALASGIIKRFLEENGFEVSLQRVELIKEIVNRKGKIVLDNRRTVAVLNGVLCEVKSEKNNNVSFKTEITQHKSDFLKKDGKINNLLLKDAIDCDKIEGVLTVRTRQSGDVISFSHRNITKPLRKLFNEDGIDVSLRDKIPVISDAKGVVWVYSYGVDKRVCADENTKTVYAVKCIKTT